MTTNYFETFIQVAEDCPVDAAEVPPARGATKTVAELQHELLVDAPYHYTSDDLLFEVHVARNGIAATDRAAERAAFFGRNQACLRTSPLAKRYGWGIHHDGEGRVALIACGSARYRELAADSSTRQLQAMRSRRG